MFISVVLPAPFSPSRATTSASLRSKDTASFATSVPKRLVIPDRRRTGGRAFMHGRPLRSDRSSARLRNGSGRLRLAVVDRHGEGAFPDRLLLFGNQRLHLVRNVVLERSERR